MKKLVVVCFIILGSLNLLANQASESLNVSMGKSPALLIPASTYSCLEVAKGTLEGGGDIAKNYFRLPNPELTWSGDEHSQIQIDMIRLTIDSKETGKYECIHSGAKLGSLFYRNFVDSNGIVYTSVWDSLLGHSTVMSTSELMKQGYKKCDLICGGLNLPENTGKFTVTGKWEVYGVERKHEQSKNYSEENPIYKKGSFELSNVVSFE